MRQTVRTTHLEEPALLSTLRAGLWRISINRPPLNTLDLAALRVLAAALRQAHDDPQTRLVVLTGAGKRAFCAGFEAGQKGTAQQAEQLAVIQEVFCAFADLAAASIPTVALVKGLALGIGCELAALCETLIACEDAEFGLPEIAQGSIPLLATATWHQRLSPRVALRLMLTGERIQAEEAHRLGLVHQVLSTERFIADAEELLLMLALLRASNKN
jgi:enoyl-CoA hydratase/carnithine racemase